MKFKVFLFGMVVAALMMSCNNESVYGPEIKNPGIESESTVATINLNFRNVNTFAGEDEITATGYETAISDAAIFIYTYDGVGGMQPEAMAYVPDANLGTPKQVTLLAKSGLKKIFLALNVKNDIHPLLDANGGTFTAKQDTGINIYLDPYTGMAFSALNNILSAPGSTDPFEIISAIPTGIGVNGGANGLIQTLAGGSITYANGVKYSTDPLTSDMYCLMTNWDGPADVNGNSSYTYRSECEFYLFPGVPPDSSQLAPIIVANQSVNNHISIGVQRAYAKISLRITANGATPSPSATAPYESTLTDGSQGRFTPWIDGTSGESIWALGGINKRTYPFQQFAGIHSAVASPNYPLATGDTILKYPLDPRDSHEWYDSYDNTRVFGPNKYYYTDDNTVTNIYDAMTTPGNSLPLSSPDIQDLGTFNFAMCTENGTEYEQWQDRRTFVIVGGTYAPRNVLTSIHNSTVSLNQAAKGWNGEPAIPNSANNGLDVNPYFVLPYGAVGSGTDTLYYLVTEKVFIFGYENLVKYYAWEELLDPNEDDPVNNMAPSVIAAMTDAIDNENLMAYFHGQCWYRVWVQDPTATSTSWVDDEYLVRRNHVYDINITRILGPGIADPNKIIIPGDKPELYTFVTADITILNWHLVSQEQDVSFK